MLQCKLFIIKDMELQDPTKSAQEANLDPIPAAEPAAESARQEVEETKLTEEAAETTPEASAVPVREPRLTSIEEAIAAAAEMAARDGADINRDEVARLKQQFYSLHNAQVEAEKAAFVEAGNDPEAFEATPSVAEEQFKVLMANIKEKKAAYVAALEAERKANLDAKNAIIDELNVMADDTDNVNRHFQRFRDLQAQFKTVGEVPAPEVSEQWKRYQAACEKFYDQLKVNKDLRDYDFKKNLDIKMLLCEEAEKLNDEADVVTAFKRLQELHDKWRETGPVAKELREDLWTRFKDASAVVNRKYQAFFEERKQRERDNESAKVAICEKVEALDFDSIKSYAGWDEMTKTILEAQEEWRKLGFASRKLNNQLFARFRNVCDKFFNMKAEYFRNMKDELSTNLAKKTALCEKAEALKDSTDWKNTTAELVELQKEWKTIGAVAKKHGDAIWHRFQEACDYFFDQKKKATTDVRKTEQANYKAKRAIIDELKAIPADTERDEAIAKVRELQNRYQQVGHVPFRDKDKLHDAYKAVIDELYERFDIRANRARMANYENAVAEMEGDDRQLLRERDRMMRALEMKRAEIHTCENNLGFFNSKSKNGDSMLREMERRIQRLRDDLATIEKKIALIDGKLG